MARNPMQRKVSNAFMLGMVLTALILGGLVAAGYIFFVAPMVEETRDDNELPLRQVMIVTQPIPYGNEIRIGENVRMDTIRTEVDGISGVVRHDVEDIEAVIEAVERALGNGNRADVQVDIMREFMGILEAEALSARITARVSLEPGTIITESMVDLEERLEQDVRYVEFNMLISPIELEIGDYVDIRITLPDGQDMIVLSRKHIHNIAGETVTFRLSEYEILRMNSAIVENYIMRASILYMVRFVDAGLQRNALLPTYEPSTVVRELIARNENIINDIRNQYTGALNASVQGGYNSRHDLRSLIDNARFHYEEIAQRNVESGMTQQREMAREARQQFLVQMGM